MSNSKNLLAEAIADAKSVKEAAIANAKAALEEAFAPYLAEKFAAKLAEIDADEVKEAYEVDEEMDGLEEKMSNPDQREGDDEKKNGKFSKESEPEMETEKMAKKLEEKDMVDEMDLEELLRELEEEEMLKENARTDAEEEGYLDGMKDEKEDEEDKEEDELDLEDMSEDELEKLVKDVIEDMVRAGEIEAGENFEEEDIDVDIDTEEEINERKKEGYDDREDESVSARRGKEADKKQSFKARRDDSYGKFGKRDAEAKGKVSGPGTNKINKENLNEEPVDEVMADLIMNPTNTEIMMGLLGGAVGVPAAALAAAYAKDGIDAVKRLVKGKKAGMEEANELNELRAELHEVNLLNAKLLYTNKIFRAKNLMETQKVKVLEAFDKATTVKEVKLVYETLNEGIKEKAPIRENLGSASRPAGVAPKQQIVEVDSQFARWQKLAGIIK